ncbi:MAG: LytR C-terminal domain-containing protein [Candidatus Levybacteria bacterium]|nr:LytR C-terminal domain-containing protein [Candidatus Levybacteria bacterium]
MSPVHKKHTTHKPEEKPEVNKQQETAPAESVVISDTVTQSSEVIEVISQPSPATVQEPEVVKEVPPSSSAVKEPPQDPLNDFKEKMNKEEYFSSGVSSKKNFMWPILFVFVISLAMLGGIFLYRQSSNKAEDVNVVSLSLTPTPTVAVEPTVVEVDLSNYKIEVLNGSEVAGEAGRQQANLEEEGFVVSSVGNANNSDYKKTIIQAKSDVEPAFLEKLKSFLEASFILGELEELSDDADSDVIVILGSE